MRAWVIAVLLVPAAGAADVEMLFHGAPSRGVLHPDGFREDPPILAMSAPCGLGGLLGGKLSWGGAWTVDPSWGSKGERRYSHGDHGFGHGFRVVDDAMLSLPFEGLPTGSPITIDATLYRGHYHIAWSGPHGDSPTGKPLATEVVATVSWTGDPVALPQDEVSGVVVHTLQLAMETADVAVAIDQGVWLQVEVRSQVDCDPRMSGVAFHASDGMWPSMAFQVADFADVKDARVRVWDGQTQAVFGVQHWQGYVGVDKSEFTVLGPAGDAWEFEYWVDADQAYHHGVQSVYILVPIDETSPGALRLILEQGRQRVLEYDGLTWDAKVGDFVPHCGREPLGYSRDVGYTEFCATPSVGETTPIPVWLVLAGLVIALRRQA